MTELIAHDTGLLVVDFQERLCAAMPDKVVEQHGKNVRNLLALANEIGLSVVVSEQYPKGLGHTIDAIAQDLPKGARHAKTMFSAWRDAGVRAAIETSGRRQWVVTGMETHICVYQTVRDLVSRDFSVHVPADTVVSRTKANWKAGLALCQQSGASITVAETVLFDLLKEGRGDAFKMVSRLIR